MPWHYTPGPLPFLPFTQLEMACEHCGIRFYVSKSKMRARRFCSRPCKDAAGRPSRKIPCTCFTCGKPFARKPSEVLAHTFCSMACRNASGPAAPPIISADGTSALIPLVNRWGAVVTHAIVDAADVAWVGQWRWHRSEGYAARKTHVGGQPINVRLHRELLGLGHGDGFEVDHWNLNRLDNRRQNLRVIPKAAQPQNLPKRATATSQYRGVSWAKANGKWTASTRLNGKRVNLGYFTDEAEAAGIALTARIEYMPYAVD